MKFSLSPDILHAFTLTTISIIYHVHLCEASELLDEDQPFEQFNQAPDLGSGIPASPDQDAERETFVNEFMADIIASHYTSSTGFTYTHSPIHRIRLADLDKKIYSYLESYASALRERLALIER
jgi:hypothetical protein